MDKVKHIVTAVKDSLRHAGTSIALHEPCFQGNEWTYVKECLDTGWVSSAGKYVDKFERDLADFTGVKYAIATVNGTAALHISYLLAGITAEDEVLVPSMTFVATVNAISYCNAIPHFIDTEKNSLGIDVAQLDDYLRQITIKKKGILYNKQTTRPIRALCAMHTLGHPVDLDAIHALCQRYNLILIEDAAEALGSYYKNKHVGNHGLVGILSFNGNKIITTGGGGAILTNHKEIALRAKHLTTTAKQSHPWLFEHDQIGYNYRLPNINAALGCAQLEQLKNYLTAKRALALRYQSIFSELSDVTFIQEPKYAKSNYWLNAFLLDTSLIAYKDKILAAFHEEGIMVRPLWNLQHTLPMFKHYPRMPLTNALDLSTRLIKLPSSPQLIAINHVEAALC